MQKRYFEIYQKRFPDFEILPKFCETHVFRGTIRHPYCGDVLICLLINTSAPSHWLKVSRDQLALSLNLGIFRI